MNTTRGGLTHDRVLLFWDGSLPDLHVGTTTLEPGNWYHIAITSTGPGGDKLYSFKIWAEGEAEPADWADTGLGNPAASRGSVLLIAHALDITFHDLQIVELP